MQKIINIGIFILALCFQTGQAGEFPRYFPYSATDSASISELSLAGMNSYSTNFFPLYMAENGRLGASAWRGMPPGFWDYEFRNMQLSNPMWGYWDDYLIPIEIISGQQLDFARQKYVFFPSNVSDEKKPVSRIAFAQDYQFDLSYLDVDFSEHYGKDSYFRLGGNNFVRNGPIPRFTKTQINTYRAQFHQHISEHLNLDLWYWQLRHNYLLGEWQKLQYFGKEKRVGQIFWANLVYEPDSLNKLTLMPYADKWGERSKSGSSNQPRESEMYTVGFKTMYSREIKNSRIFVTADVFRHRITQGIPYNKGSQLGVRASINGDLSLYPFTLQAMAGFSAFQYVGHGPSLGISLQWQSLPGVLWKVAYQQSPGEYPLALLFWNGSAPQRQPAPDLPWRQGLNGTLQLGVSQKLEFRIQPFVNYYKKYWQYSSQVDHFYQTEFESRGFTTQLSSDWGRLNFKNEFTYGYDYKNSFIPGLNNVFTANLNMALFKNALQLQGYAIYHFVDNWQLLEYQPYVNQFTRTGTRVGPYHLLDFKVLAHIRTATLFFVWENTLSQDYEYVQGYQEVFRLFRLGVYWTLFD